LGDGELVDDIASGRIELSAIDSDQQRQHYLKEEVDKLGNTEKSQDYQILRAVSEQADKKGISYKDAAPALSLLVILGVWTRPNRAAYNEK
jgi:hypothetical protein